MGKHKRKPPVFAGNVARQAQTRYLRTKKPESERVQENREAAGHVICLCFMVALNDRYGIGEGRLQRVTDAANGELERFAINQRAVGMERAKKLLNETLAGLYDGNFVLPITKPPKKARDWAMLGEQREAAEIVVKCYAQGAGLWPGAPGGDDQSHGSCVPGVWRVGKGRGLLRVRHAGKTADGNSR